MTTFKCSFCHRIFSNRSASTQHIRHCMSSDDYSVHSSSEESEIITDINDMSLGSDEVSN